MDFEPELLYYVISKQALLGKITYVPNNNKTCLSVVSLYQEQRTDTTKNVDKVQNVSGSSASTILFEPTVFLSANFHWLGRPSWKHQFEILIRLPNLKKSGMSDENRTNTNQYRFFLIIKSVSMGINRVRVRRDKYLTSSFEISRLIQSKWSRKSDVSKIRNPHD